MAASRLELSSCSGNTNDIDTAYLDGVSITHGSPRQHIWSYASSQTTQAGITECPCSTDNTVVNPGAFVGDNYYCEAGGGGGNPLWDGLQCQGIEAPCCNIPN